MEIPQELPQLEKNMFTIFRAFSQEKDKLRKDAILSSLMSCLEIAQQMVMRELGKTVSRPPIKDAGKRVPFITFQISAMYRRMRNKNFQKALFDKVDSLARRYSSNLEAKTAASAKPTEQIQTFSQTPRRHSTIPFPDCKFRSELIKKGGCSCNDVFHCSNPEYTNGAEFVDKKRSECRRCKASAVAS